MIINYARFAQSSVPPGSPAAADIEEIRRAAERGVGLVRQLMILARRESGVDHVFDLNELISGLDGFLRSTIGEHIIVERKLAERLWPLADDPARIEQILINLAVNSRDAMPGGGTLTFETGNAELGAADTIAHPGVEPGRFVRLLVTDTGVGHGQRGRLAGLRADVHDQGLRARAPGLGLATVYTIVTQAGGHDRPLLEARAGDQHRDPPPAGEPERAARAAGRPRRPPPGAAKRS